MTDVGVAILAVTQGVSVFQSILPPITQVRKASLDDTEFVGDVRLGEVAAASMTVGVGVIVSALTGDPVPAYVAVIVAFALVYMYELTLRKDRPMERKSTLTVLNGLQDLSGLEQQ